MRSRAYRKRLLLFLISAVIFSFIQSVSSFAADTTVVKYYYDDLNRLIRVENTGNKEVVEYVYDEVGNRTSKVSYAPRNIATTALANGSITPSGSVAYKSDQLFTITITPNAGFEVLDVLVDGVSVGYENTYSFTNVLINHAVIASFQAYVAPYRIGSTSYATLKEAYDAAIDGATIKAKAKTYDQSLIADKPKAVTIEGGYAPNFNNITRMTTLKGYIQTTATGGTLTIKNFILNNQ